MRSIKHSVMLISFIIFASIVFSPTSAYAHGIGGNGASASSAKVQEISPKPEGFFVDSVENGQRIKIKNMTNDDLIVIGVDKEAYLKINKTGVYVNEKSATAIINKSTTGKIPDPSEFSKTSADPNETPEWKKLSTKNEYIFHDHRAHYMGATPDNVTNLGNNFLPLRLNKVDYKVTFNFFTKDKPATPAWLLSFFFLAALLILLILKTKMKKIVFKKVNILILLFILFALELFHVIAYIEFVHESLFKSLGESLYGLILLAITFIALIKISCSKTNDFLNINAPTFCAIGLFGLLVDTFGEYNFFFKPFLPTSFSYFYTRLTLVVIGLISIVFLTIGSMFFKTNADETKSIQVQA